MRKRLNRRNVLCKEKKMSAKLKLNLILFIPESHTSRSTLSLKTGILKKRGFRKKLKMLKRQLSKLQDRIKRSTWSRFYQQSIQNSIKRPYLIWILSTDSRMVISYQRNLKRRNKSKKLISKTRCMKGFSKDWRKSWISMKTQRIVTMMLSEIT